MQDTKDLLVGLNDTVREMVRNTDATATDMNDSTDIDNMPDGTVVLLTDAVVTQDTKLVQLLMPLHEVLDKRMLELVAMQPAYAEMVELKSNVPCININLAGLLVELVTKLYKTVITKENAVRAGDVVTLVGKRIGKLQPNTSYTVSYDQFNVLLKPLGDGLSRKISKARFNKEVKRNNIFFGDRMATLYEEEVAENIQRMITDNRLIVG